MEELFIDEIDKIEFSPNYPTTRQAQEGVREISTDRGGLKLQ